MLRKILHWSLFAAIALWLLAAWGIRRQEDGRNPARISAIIAADLRRAVHAAGQIDHDSNEVLAWLGSRQDQAANSNWISAQPFRLFAYRDDSLVAWSTTMVVAPARMPGVGKLYQLGNGAYYGYSIQRSWLPRGIRLSLVFSIAHQYPFNNEYLQPAFTASDAIDPHVAVADTAVSGAAQLLAPDGRVIGWVHPPPQGDVPEPPANWIVACWLLSLVVFGAWLQRCASLVVRAAGTGRGMAFLAVVAIGIRVLLIWLGPPFRIAETDLFSPRLYASSTLLPSLGDLLLHVLTALWVLLFIVPRIRYSKPDWPLLLRWLLSISMCCGLFLAGLWFIDLTRSLVLDSLIPFDTQHLSSLNGNSVAGLFIASLLLSILLVTAGVVLNVLRLLLSSFRQQVVLLILGAALLGFMFRGNALLPLYAITALWLTINILGQFVDRLREGAGIFKVGNIFWSVAHCLLLALLLQHFSRVRESEARRHFAEHIATRHDDAMEYNFGQSLTQIRTDTALQAFYRKPSQPARKKLEERLASLFFNNTLPGYQAQVYLYNVTGRPVFNRDTTALEALKETSAAAIPSRTATDLFYREGATDDHIYLALASVEDSLGAPLGTMGIDLEQKKIVSETVLPELLQPATINQAEKAAGYSYAIYAGGRLVAQTSDYPFPFYIGHDTTHATYHERHGNDFSTLIYSPDAYRSVYVWRRFGTLSEAITLFSYLLLLRLLLLALGAAFGPGAQWVGQPRELLKKLRGIGLRRRLQLSIMGIVAFSFIGIGIATVIFLRHQYDNNGKTRRQAMMQVVARAIQQWMRDRDYDDSAPQWRNATATPDFRYFLSGLAAAQKIDINLFDASGRLTNTTQQSIYDQDLLAPLMRHSVLTEFSQQPRALITEVESIGALTYQSCYAPLRAEGGDVAVYLNIPLFYAQRELDEQISSVVVTLINLYAAALLLSGLLAYFITRWVTRAFDLIIRQFGRLNLHRNERLQWPYDDEVGVLVAEYNKMVRKVEDSVALLARNERAGAFREMARQVAHEIKNPLTPMSLYVQRLQRAIKSDEPDALALAGRVSEALLEQINNLSVIATEFGEFARIGSARPEEMELSGIVRNVAEPFAADPALALRCDLPEAPIHVMADRSQMVRIITNLMKNAIQAIPADRTGEITVRLALEGAEAVLSVADNGAGISPEAQEKLFTPYFTTKGSGTGLGLAMSRQMLEAWGGDIGYETAEGEGTTFFIRLPTL